MSIFEAGMLVCFGAAWPVNLYKSWTTRSARGKSVAFLYVILIGYASGIVHKILHSPDLVLALYVANSLMVTADVILYYRNRALDRKAGAGSA